MVLVHKWVPRLALYPHSINWGTSVKTQKAADKELEVIHCNEILHLLSQFTCFPNAFWSYEEDKPKIMLTPIINTIAWYLITF